MSMARYHRCWRCIDTFTENQVLRTVDQNLLSRHHYFECFSPTWNDCMEILTHYEITCSLFPIIGHCITTWKCLSFLTMPNWPHCFIKIFNITSICSHMFFGWMWIFLYNLSRWFKSYHPKFFSAIYMVRYWFRIFLFPLWICLCSRKYISWINSLLLFIFLWWINRSSTHSTHLVCRFTKEF